MNFKFKISNLKLRMNRGFPRSRFWRGSKSAPTKVGASPKFTTGFTILELVVVVSIMAILTTIVIFNYQRFSANVTLENLAQDIAIRIVEAQKAAISGIANVNTILGTAPRYGVYFKAASNPTPGLGGNEQFVYFFDLGGDKILNTDSNGIVACTSTIQQNSECISRTTITSGEYISKILVPDPNNTATSIGQNTISITFTRPFPDATIRRLSSLTPGPSFISAQIELTSPRSGAKKTIMVSKIGQVSVRDGGAL